MNVWFADPVKLNAQRLAVVVQVVGGQLNGAFTALAVPGSSTKKAQEVKAEEEASMIALAYMAYLIYRGPR